MNLTEEQLDVAARKLCEIWGEPHDKKISDTTICLEAARSEIVEVLYSDVYRAIQHALGGDS